MYFCRLFLKEECQCTFTRSSSRNVKCVFTICSSRSVNVFLQVVPEGAGEVRDAAGGRRSLLRDVGGEVLDLRDVL